MSTLPLDDIVKIIVSASQTPTARKGFNIGLIVGNSTVISASDRTKVYTGTTEMIADGFESDDPECKAADLYFKQDPHPSKVVIGRWDTSGSETITQALTACRAKNSDWYAYTVTGAAKATVLLAAAWAETAKPVVSYFYTTADADVKAGTTGNVLSTLKGLLYKRTLGMYSATADAISAIMGYAMGANTRLTNSAYTLANKPLIGVPVDDLTETEVETIRSNNGNVYVNVGNTYNVFLDGKRANGSFFDELINTDMLVNDIQMSIMDLLTTLPKIAQTTPGVTQLVSAIETSCETSVNTGFLAPGKWTNASFKSVSKGDMLVKGYLVLADSIDDQSASDRANRIAPSIYVLCKLAGAIHSVMIQIQVNG